MKALKRIPLAGPGRKEAFGPAPGRHMAAILVSAREALGRRVTPIY